VRGAVGREHEASTGTEADADADADTNTHPSPPPQPPFPNGAVPGTARPRSTRHRPHPHTRYLLPSLYCCLSYCLTVLLSYCLTVLPSFNHLLLLVYCILIHYLIGIYSPVDPTLNIKLFLVEKKDLEKAADVSLVSSCFTLLLLSFYPTILFYCTHIHTYAHMHICTYAYLLPLTILLFHSPTLSFNTPIRTPSLSPRYLL
jgi:hypothetical protein